MQKTPRGVLVSWLVVLTSAFLCTGEVAVAQIPVMSKPTPYGSIFFSADGRRLVTIGEACNVHDAATGKVLLRLPLSSYKRDADVDRAASRLALLYGWFGCTLKVWDLHSGAKVGSLDMPSTFSPDHVAFFPGARRLVVSDRTTTWLWTIGSPDPPQELLGGTAAVSPDGRVVATSNPGGGLYFYEAGTPTKPLATWFDGEILYSSIFDDKEHRTAALCFSPDGRLLAQRRTWDTCLWDLATGRKVAVLPGKAVSFRKSFVCFRPDGRKVVTDFGNFVRLWDVASGNLECLLPVLPGIRRHDLEPTSIPLFRIRACWSKSLEPRFSLAGGGASFSANGKVLGISGFPQTYALWSLRSLVPCTVVQEGSQPSEDDRDVPFSQARPATPPPVLSLGPFALNRTRYGEMWPILGPCKTRQKNSGFITWYHAPSGTALEASFQSLSGCLASMTLYRTRRAPHVYNCVRTKVRLDRWSLPGRVGLGCSRAALRGRPVGKVPDSVEEWVLGIAGPHDPVPAALVARFAKNRLVRLCIAVEEHL